MSAVQPQPSVVVGIDGSRDGLIALDWAVSYAARKHWPIRGIHVVDHSRRAHSPPAAPERDDGSEIIDDAAAELARLDYPDAKLEIHHGNPAEVLLEAARDASLLVIGRRGAGGFAELVMGSTSQVVTALATTPLVVVPDCWHGPDQGHVVVGVDGSSSCQDALGFGFEVVSANTSELVAVNATDLPETFPRPDVWLDRDDAPWQAEARRLMGEALAGWEEKYPNVGVRSQYVAGHPIHVLALASETADLIVVGGLGRTKFTPLRMGSVSRGLLHHTHCPVAVIHGGNQI